MNRYFNDDAEVGSTSDRWEQEENDRQEAREAAMVPQEVELG